MYQLLLPIEVEKNNNKTALVKYLRERGSFQNFPVHIYFKKAL